MTQSNPTTLRRSAPLVLAVLAAAGLNGCGRDEGPKLAPAEAAAGDRGACLKALAAPDPASPKAGLVRVEGGRFSMGASPEHPEEGPPQDVTVGSFWIDPTEVTNAQFARFVAATGYVTLAEKPLDPALYPGARAEDLAPSSLVFVGGQSGVDLNDPGQWWRIVKGADWRHPEGPGSSIAGRDHLPVVHVAYEDALAYARWLGRDLPTEAEWEYAARGGLKGAKYTWGDAPPSASPKPQANVWQGLFPIADEGSDGYKAKAAPVGCYAPNGYGLFDMAGNVWEWTRDWYRPNLAVSDPRDPQGPPRSAAHDPADPSTAKHVAKGGSFLCADNYCFRYRPAARTAGPPDGGASHIGFRTILRDQD